MKAKLPVDHISGEIKEYDRTLAMLDSRGACILAAPPCRRRLHSAFYSRLVVVSTVQDFTGLLEQFRVVEKGVRGSIFTVLA